MFYALATFVTKNHSFRTFDWDRCTQMVDRMLDSGVIRGFTTVVDRNAMGWNTEAYVQVYCHGRISPDELRRAWIDAVNAAR